MNDRSSKTNNLLIIGSETVLVSLIGVVLIRQPVVRGNVQRL